jgi:cytochrome c-type biogenesis protein CcmH/NrfG
MRKDSVAFVIAGFAIGFGIFFNWTKHRAPQVLNAFPPRLVVPSASATPPEAPAGDPQGQPPPVDLAAVQKLQDRIKADPNDFDALVELGNVDFDQRNYPEAVTYYSRALAIHDDQNVRTDLGTMLFYSNRYDEAITELKKVLAVNPTHAQALFNMGVVLLHGKNDPQGALQNWQKLIDTNPNFPQAATVRQQIQALKDTLKKQ